MQSLHLFRISLRRALALAVAVIVLSLLWTGLPVRSGIVGAGPPANVQAAKLDQALGRLGQPSSPEEHEQALHELTEVLFLSNLVVLPTKGNEQGDTQADYGQWRQDVDRAINELNNFVNGGNKTPDTGAEAAEVRNFLQLMREAMDELAQQTNNCNPELLTGPFCQRLLSDDHAPAISDPAVGDYTVRALRSPIPFLIDGIDREEEGFELDGIANGDCAALVKETRGIQAIVRGLEVSVWEQPFLRKRTIVGVTDVWALEFVPAEHIKTISYCNTGGSLAQSIEEAIVLDRGSASFWPDLD